MYPTLSKKKKKICIHTVLEFGSPYGCRVVDVGIRDTVFLL